MEIIKTQKQLLKDFDIKYIEIMTRVTEDIYEFGKDPKDYEYFKPFYYALTSKLLDHFIYAHNTNVRERIRERIYLIESEYSDWEFLISQYYRFINVKNEFIKEDIIETESED